VNTRATAALDDVPEALRWPPGYVPPEIWETREVLLDGVKETWSLRWKRPPRFNGCPLEPSCACFGVEWGLVGALELVRERPGAPVERLDLGALREGGAQIPGFLASPLDSEERDDHGNLVRPGATLAQMVKRPRQRVMDLHDYDHDGWAAELVFQVGYWACGQNPSVLVGVSKANPHLHVFGTAEHPVRPLVMTYESAWSTILRARGKTVEVPLQECGDHGGGGHYLTLRFDPAAGFRVVDDAAWDCDLEQSPPRRTVRIPPERRGPSADAGAGTSL
jgi:hypothetical protein